jgi:hypothetical protein
MTWDLSREKIDRSALLSLRSALPLRAAQLALLSLLHSFSVLPFCFFCCADFLGQKYEHVS